MYTRTGRCHWCICSSELDLLYLLFSKDGRPAANRPLSIMPCLGQTQDGSETVP